MILKNTAGQGVYLFASNRTTGAGLAGDQANITGAISKDGAAENAFATANPTNIGGGLYWQPLSQAETNCNVFGMRWASTTADILIEPIVGFTDQGRIDAAMTSRAPASTALTNTTWTDARAAFLDAAMSSRAPSATALSNATWTDAKAVFIDAAISSRMATFTYTAPSTPPTVVQIRTEMDTNSTRLANLDAAISTRSTYAGGDTGGTTTLLGRLTSGRATNLDNLDATVTSRASQVSVNAVATTLSGILDVNVIEVGGETVTVMEFTEATADEIAVAVRDVNNLTPALDSLGAAVNAAGAGGGGGGDTKEAIAAEVWETAPAGTPLADIADALVDAMDSESSQLAKLNGIITTTNATQSSLALGVIVATNNDKSGYVLGPAGLNSIPLTLTGLPTNFREWIIWFIHRLMNTEKVKVSDSASVIRVRGSNGNVVTEQDVNSGPTLITIGDVREPG